MTNDIYEILLKIEADVADLKEAQEELHNLQEELANTREQLEAGFNLNIGAKISDFVLSFPDKMMGTIRAFGVQEQAVAKLNVALQRYSNISGDMLPALTEFASRMQKITIYGDEQIISMQAFAASMGVGAGQMEHVITNAIGLSSALGMDVNTAVKAASAAFQGNVKMLTEYIPTLRQCKTEAEKLARVQELAANGFKQAREEARGSLGNLQQLSNAWGDVSEVLGEGFAPIVKSVSEALRVMAEFLSENKEMTIILSRALISLAIAFTFQKIGGLEKVSALFKLVKLSMSGSAAAATAAAASTEAVGTAAAVATPVVSGLGIALKSAFITSGIGLIVLGLTYAFEAWANSAQAAKEKLDELQASVDGLAQSNAAQAAADMQLLGQTGATWQEIYAIQIETSARITDAYKRLKEAQGQGLNDSAIFKEIKAYEELQRILMKNYDNYQALKRIREEDNTNSANLKFEEARKKHILESGSAEEKLRVIMGDYSKQFEKVSRLQKEFNESKGEVRLEVANELAIEGEKLDKLSAQKKTLADSIKSQREKTAESVRNYNIELAILRARISGDKEGIKSAENQKKIAQYAKDYLETFKTEKMTKEQLRALEDTALKTARDRVKLEDEALRIEKEREQLKNRESTIEDYIYRLKIAQAKAAGNMLLVEQLEAAKQQAQDLKKLIEEGFDPKYAAQMIKSVSDAEKRASKTEDGGGVGSAPKGGSSPSQRRKGDNSPLFAEKQSAISSMGADAGATRRPRATVSARALEMFGEKGKPASLSWDDVKKGKGVPQPPSANKIMGSISAQAAKAAEISGVKPADPKAQKKQNLGGDKPVAERSVEEQKKILEESRRLTEDSKKLLESIDRNIKALAEGKKDGK